MNVLLVNPGPRPGTVTDSNRQTRVPPENWEFLPAGDSGITRKVKERTQTWVVQSKHGKRTISLGIWADRSCIALVKEEVAQQRATPQYARQKEQETRRKEKKEKQYSDDFFLAVLRFLDFHTRYTLEAKELAARISTLATPVGSGTVARTTRIPLAERARAATIAWLRHQTTGYDHMKIARIRGKRREVRRELALTSLEILADFRKGYDRPADCPLLRALMTHD